MTDISAFVGHSFTDDDEIVVRKFLDYLDQIQKSVPYFSWDHAQAAQPSELASKVISIMETKDVFIGICTRKEMAIDESLLVDSKIGKPKKFSPIENFEWKTSDWIIQEIGLAIGLKLSLILLVEKGVRRPGGLQGNVEYIEFERDHPDTAFGKILEMINAMGPRPASEAAVIEAPKTNPINEEAREDEIDYDRWTRPEPDWEWGNYELAYIHCLLDGDIAKLETINQNFLSSDHGQDPHNKARWEAFQEEQKISFDHGGSLSRLKNLASGNPDNPDVLQSLGASYAKFEDFESAGRCFELASTKSDKNETRMFLLGQAAQNYCQAQLEGNTNDILNQMRELSVYSEDGEERFVRTLQQLSEIRSDAECNLATMEKILQMNPGDHDLRFSLAFKHSERGNNDLAIFHYLRIPVHVRTSSAWNNLGVAFDEAALSAKSVEAYMKARDMDASLAMSNLAKKYLAAGFIEEAQNECDRALALPDYHKNVGTTLARLKSLPDQESEKEHKLLEHARAISEFYGRFGGAVSMPPRTNLAGKWQGPECLLDVSLDNAEFKATGAYDETTGGLASILASVEPTKKTIAVEYNGTIQGDGIKGKLIRRDSNKKPRRASLLEIENDSVRVLLIYDSESSEFRVLENPNSSNSKFYSLSRVV